MYAYITQGRPDRGLLRLSPRAQAIITQGIGVYAAPLLQPTQITTRTTQGNPVYVYHHTAIARLPIPSDTDIIYFTDASSTQQRTPTVGCASVRISRHADGLHVEHHTGATIFGASSHGELRCLADAITTTLPPATIQPRNIWVVVVSTIDIHLTRRLADKALESGLTTQGLGLWMAFRGIHLEDTLHIVKQESHRYTYGNGCTDTQAKHQSTSHTSGLKHVRLDTPHHSRLQHLSPIPSATQPLQMDTRGHADTALPHPPKQQHTPTTDPPAGHPSPPPTHDKPHTPTAGSPPPHSTPTLPSGPHKPPAHTPGNPGPIPPAPDCSPCELFSPAEANPHNPTHCRTPAEPSPEGEDRNPAPPSPTAADQIGPPGRQVMVGPPQPPPPNLQPDDMPSILPAVAAAEAAAERPATARITAQPASPKTTTSTSSSSSSTSSASSSDPPLPAEFIHKTTTKAEAAASRKAAGGPRPHTGDPGTPAAHQEALPPGAGKLAPPDRGPHQPRTGPQPKIRSQTKTGAQTITPPAKAPPPTPPHAAPNTTNAKEAPQATPR